jgi:choline dehydrogenase-like flavoprotein
MPEHACVLGSGPTATVCAHTLSQAGMRVTILDVGLEIDEQSTALLDEYRTSADAVGLVDSIHRLRAGHAELSTVQPGKYLFGSDHVYRTIPETEVSFGDDSVVRSSLAKGGLSSVWGATVSTVVAKDIADWPISFAELEPHYRELENIMSVVSPTGEMRGIFPMDIGGQPGFPLGLQGQHLLDRLDEHASTLLEDGIHVGRAKLAVGSKYSLDGLGCTPCGLCMHGCPNQAIFSAAYLLDELKNRSGIEYQQNILAESFAESSNRVTVKVKDLVNDVRSVRTFDRLFVACGAINSTALVARSLGMTNHEFEVKDSQKYIFPLLRWKRSKGAANRTDNTLAQIYLAIDNQTVSDNIVQVQYYGYNDLILDPLRMRLGKTITRVVARLAKPLLERLIIVFVYLHSSESGKLILRVHDIEDEHGRFGVVRGQSNPRSDTVIQALLGLLKRHRQAHGGLPIRAGLQSTKPGDSQHIGGTLPMSRKPGKYQTDTLGRPYSCRRVHVVDSSVFPSVPGTPITYTAMANASRIAAAAAKESHEV